MRGEISDLIRKTLYPDLRDGENTIYPPVRGTQHNVFFMNHRHQEDKSGSNQFALQSHSNSFEAKMIVGMVKYFVRNGYDKPGDIAVLTPYLGQMMKIRDQLKTSFVVVIDERDQENIDKMSDEITDDVNSEENSSSAKLTSTAEKRSLQQQVVLRTVDNFQGEEAKIVLISLVRNTGGDDARGTIGFLKSKNRTNVLLSRAQHGMYLLGNAALLAEKSPDMWRLVIDMLQERRQIGPAFPIACHQHPEFKRSVYDPQDFPPDGGCFEPCQHKLPNCGHVCPFKCHSDDREHIGVYCTKPCARLHPICQHPCRLQCGADCGVCRFTITNISLACGHVHPQAECHLARDPSKIRCKTKKTGVLPRCGHEKVLFCYQDITETTCESECGHLLECGHLCRSRCDKCQKLSTKANNDEPPLDEQGHVRRTNHPKCLQTCNRNLFCGHVCEENCHQGKGCPPCKKKCTIMCKHSKCKQNCSEPCIACAEPCDWSCRHQNKCPLTCGAPCARLPCDEKCGKVLTCDHPCQGVCGEQCPSPEMCIICAPEHVKSQVVDLVMQETFERTDWDVERMIPLECGHVFTMETMDLHMEMTKFYVGENADAPPFTNLKQLPAELSSGLKTCPNCRAPIKNVRRYGRAIKKATLDIQNRKFIQKWSGQLGIISKAMENMEKTALPRRESFLNKIAEPISIVAANITPENHTIPSYKISNLSEVENVKRFAEISKTYGMPRAHEVLWVAYMRFLFDIYRNISTIMSGSKNPPHKRAYEAAVSSLFRKKNEIELDEILNHFNEMNLTGDTPAQQLSRHEESLAQVGILTPMVDQGIYLDALLQLINVQKIFFYECSEIIEKLPETLDPRQFRVNLSEERKRWIKFAEEILKSNENHIILMLEVSLKTNHMKKYVLAAIENAELECKRQRFTIKHHLDEPLTVEMLKSRRSTRSSLKTITEKILPKMDLPHFQQECGKRIATILESIEELDRGGTLTHKEKLQIFNAMKNEFSGSGHWYECPNGHPYTIGECGMAMQASRCPECGATIGGGDHTLTGDNRRNIDFENLYRA